ncbi:HD domain-containing phosphohydrolase [Propionigenium maris]|uniref:HD domain-containing phosphohydrolase n=1 Tax=Propionigenium maris TaxID=45622 RepID=UPI0024930A96|nr:HD domain-containing phosphohydrolase [Propionigenium maris]
MKKWIYIIIYLFFFLVTYSQSRKNVLILHSYSEDYLWTREIQDGILEGLEGREGSYNISLEYMDTKNFPSVEYLEEYDRLFSYKYTSRKIDLVIAVDDRAFSYVLSRREDIFKGVPILGTGLNTLEDEYLEAEDAYIMVEEPDYEANIKLALKQNSDAEKIYFITDITPTGQKIKREVEKVAENYDIEREWLEDLTLEELKGRVESLGRKDIIIYLVFFMDRLGNSYSYYEPIAEVSRASKVPIYINWSFYLNTGAFGGYAFDGRRMGVQTIDVAEGILEGEEIPRVTGTSQRSSYVFDYNVIQERSLEYVYYPLKSVFLNRPETFYRRNRRLILTFLGVLGVLTTILLLVYINLVKERTINARDRELLDTQKDLLNRLGDVIEYRSRETADHAGRVAKISKFIALKVGCTQKEAEIIEIASPLHDIGKIGVPDEILNFPGRYTEEQFREMKKHANIGYDILKGSGRRVIDAAATIAHEHHERWDGKGYPRHLKEDEINLFARITMVADVMDALLSERSYKRAWTYDETLEYIIQGKGEMFDPKIVEVVETYRDELRKISTEV